MPYCLRFSNLTARGLADQEAWDAFPGAAGHPYLVQSATASESHSDLFDFMAYLFRPQERLIRERRQRS